jgi:hypothetical protein
MSPLQAPLLPVKEDARYEPLLAQTEENWRQNSPRLVKRLEKKGQLQKVLENAVELAIISLQQCEKQGMAPDQAREIAYENLSPPPDDLQQ